MSLTVSGQKTEIGVEVAEKMRILAGKLIIDVDKDPNPDKS